MTLGPVAALCYREAGELEKVGRRSRCGRGVGFGRLSGRSWTDESCSHNRAHRVYGTDRAHRVPRDRSGTNGSLGTRRAPSGPTGPDVRFTKIRFKASALNGEWAVLQNLGDTPAAMGGWTLSSRRDTYTFRGFTLQPGARVTMHSGEGTDTSRQLYLNARHFIWGDRHDVGRLRDASRPHRRQVQLPPRSRWWEPLHLLAR